MFKNYLAIALRNIRQFPLYAFINICSLAIGLAACLVIYLFISDERSFDAFHKKKDNIYRLDEVQNFTGTNEQNVALSMPGMGPTLAAEFPEVRSYTRYWNRGRQLLERGTERLLIDNIVMADSTFLEIFDFPLLHGDAGTALDEPNCIVITESTARKFFREDEVLGKVLQNQGRDMKITGVLKDVPENSHLQFDVLISMPTITREDASFNDRWGGNFLNTYLLLNPGVNVAEMEAKFPAYLRRHMSDPDINKYYRLYLQKLPDVHLGSTDIEHDYNNYRKFNGKYLDIFTIIGVFILLIAGVNFMNLTTARASHRWKEIGVRKTVGAKKNQLFLQFIFESVLLAVFALMLAFVLDLAFIPLVNNLVGRELSLMTFFESPANFLLAVLITFLLGILTGIYPSFYMTSFNMSRVLKGNKAEGRSLFRSALVILQFGLALAMIVSTLVVAQQLGFMKNKDIGFDKDQMMLIDMNREANEKFETLKIEMEKSPFVKGVTASGQRIGNNFHQWGFKVKADTAIINITPSNVNVDFDYLKVYGIKLKEGRGFSKDYPTDKGLAFVINESLAKELNMQNPVGTPAGHGWYPDDSLGTIIGVAEDFNFNSLHYEINTLSMVVHPEWGYSEMSVKIAGTDVSQAVEEIKKIWESQVTTFPFQYTFLDDHFEQLYRSDQQMSAVVMTMAGLAILISCMGLFGLAAITTSRKTKEIGIRKVLGATEAQITMLLSGTFTALVLISFVIVSPVTYWLLSRWLETFAYRIEINPIVFVAGGGLALAIALATISYHTIRCARENPVKALRYE